jgi:hypothetical protein
VKSLSLLPWWVKAAGIAAVVLAAISFIVWGVKSIRQEGFEAGMAKKGEELQTLIAASEKSRADALERLIALDREIATMQAEANRKEAEAEARGRASVAKTKEVIRANPKFAAVVRPAALGSVRDEQLSDIAAEAAAAPKLPDSGVRTVRPAGQRE